MAKFEYCNMAECYLATQALLDWIRKMSDCRWSNGTNVCDPWRILLLISVLIAGLLSSPGAKASEEGIVAAFPFDAGEGEIAVDPRGGHDAWILGSEWEEEGKYGKALRFDGEDDCVEVPHGEEFDFESEFTLEAWVKPEGILGEAVPVLAVLRETDPYLSLYVSGIGSSFWYDAVNFPGYVEATGLAEVPNEGWTHIALTDDEEEARLYVNGELIESAEGSLRPSREGPLLIGCGPGMTFFDGSIDEVRFYVRALDPEEVEEDMETEVGMGSGPPDPGPIVETSTAVDVKSTKATLTGKVNPRSLATTYQFEYGTSMSYGISLPASPKGVSPTGSANVEVSETATGLLPNTKYYFRLLASNAEGIVSGDMGTFTTAAPPNTVIDLGPSGGTDDPTPTFTFHSTDAISSFECRVDALTWSECESAEFTPAEGLSDGQHVFEARAIDAFGAVDPSPASRHFVVDSNLPEAIPLSEATPVAAYSFDEGEGNATSDSVHNHDGVIHGATWTKEGRYGAALEFDGEDDFVRIPDNDALDFTDGFTLEAWVLPDREQSDAPILIKETSSFYAYRLDAVGEGADVPEGSISEGDWISESVSGRDELSDERWNHLALTYDGDSDRLRLYVDGELVSIEEAFDAQVGNGALRIGGSKGGDFFNGLIDEVRLYDRALGQVNLDEDTGAEIGLPPRSTPIAALSFDEGEGKAARDSANDHDATLHGATWTEAGKYGSALEFDGSDDYLSILDSDALDVTDDFTLEAWVFPDSAQNDAPIFTKETSGLYSYRLDAGGAEWAIPEGFIADTDSSSESVAAEGELPSESWSHLALTYAGDSDRLRLYVDGELVGEADAPAAQIGSGALKIGGNKYGDFFSGRIDEIRLYDRALGTARILDDMEEEIGLVQPVFHATLYTGDPLEGGEVLAEEWAQPDLRLSKRETSSEIITRSVTACSSKSDQACIVQRKVLLPIESEESEVDPSLGNVSEVEVPFAEAVTLPDPAFMLAPSAVEFGTAVETGELASVIEPWQVPPPGAGATYELIRSGHAAKEGEPAESWEFWVDTATQLPVKAEFEIEGEDPEFSYYSYQVSTEDLDDLSADFFEAAPPEIEAPSCSTSTTVGGWQFSPSSISSLHTRSSDRFFEPLRVI